LQPTFHRLIEQVGNQRRNLTSLGASKRDVTEKFLPLESLDYGRYAVVTANPEVVSLGNIVG
jgi:hypothetical protein